MFLPFCKITHIWNIFIIKTCYKNKETKHCTITQAEQQHQKYSNILTRTQEHNGLKLPNLKYRHVFKVNPSMFQLISNTWILDFYNKTGKLQQTKNAKENSGNTFRNKICYCK